MNQIKERNNGMEEEMIRFLVITAELNDKDLPSINANISGYRQPMKQVWGADTL